MGNLFSCYKQKKEYKIKHQEIDYITKILNEIHIKDVLDLQQNKYIDK